MKLVFATNNKNKLSEIKLLVPKDIRILSLKDIGCNETLPETSLTLEGNSLQKAKFVYDNYGYNCFADDTGLEVDVLDGAPGVYSARYAGKECIAENNINLLLKNLEGIKNRNAKFRTIISLIIDGEKYKFEGSCLGNITSAKCGKLGFGYDPIFSPEGYNVTFAEMSKVQKGKISHRGKAIEKLVAFFR